MLPELARTCPEQAQRIRNEHEQIRAAIVQLGVDLDLHALCPTSATVFIEALRKHASFEEQTVYPWAQARLGESARRSRLERLRGSLLRARGNVTWPEHAVREQEVEPCRLSVR